jgi:hypothetical protein
MRFIKYSIFQVSKPIQIENWDGITINDFHSILLQLKPDILHISTHYTKNREPIFIDEKEEAGCRMSHFL